jgi:hypothetical protein
MPVRDIKRSEQVVWEVEADRWGHVRKMIEQDPRSHDSVIASPVDAL